MMKKVGISILFLMFILGSVSSQITETSYNEFGNIRPEQFVFKEKRVHEIINCPSQSENRTYSNVHSIWTRLKKKDNLKKTLNNLSEVYSSVEPNKIQLSPKHSYDEKIFNLDIPLGFLFEKFEYHGNTEQETYFRISLRIFYKPVLKRVFELYIIPMSDTYFQKIGGNSSSFGLNLGLGFSNNFNAWNIRPEARVFFIGEYTWALGVTGSIVLK